VPAAEMVTVPSSLVKASLSDSAAEPLSATSTASASSYDVSPVSTATLSARAPSTVVASVETTALDEVVALLLVLAVDAESVAT